MDTGAFARLDGRMKVLRRTIPRALAVLALSLAMAPAAVAAQDCAPPADLTPWAMETPKPGQVQSGVTVAYHLLTISWAPEWCRTNGAPGTEQRLDCLKPTGFFLHGLWPNGAAPPYPGYCRPVPSMSRKTLRQMYCRTPSAELLQHEWQKHGACAWRDAASYFRQAAKLYDRVVIPSIEAIPPESLTAGVLRAAFVAKNPWLKLDMMWVELRDGGRLLEVRICHDLKFRPMRCTSGIGAPDAAHVRLTPSPTGAF